MWVKLISHEDKLDNHSLCQFGKYIVILFSILPVHSNFTNLWLNQIICRLLQQYRNIHNLLFWKEICVSWQLMGLGDHVHITDKGPLFSLFSWVCHCGSKIFLFCNSVLIFLNWLLFCQHRWDIPLCYTLIWGGTHGIEA